MPDLYPRLWRYCLALTGRKDWAEELSQSACLRALEKSDSFEAGTHVDRWLFRLTRNIWLNELRSRKVRQGAGLVAVEDVDIPDNSAPTEMNIFAREVLNHVNALPEAQRETLLLTYVEGYSYKETAEILEIPIGTVMSRLATARRALADLGRDTQGKTG